MEITSSSGKKYQYNPADGRIYPAGDHPDFEVVNPPLVPKQTNLDGPVQLVIFELTQRCNLRCTYCRAAHGNDPTMRPMADVDMADVTADAALRLLEDLAGPDTAVSHYGGEPLLNLHQLQRIVEARPDLSHRIDTNGIAVTDSMAAWAAGHNVSWQISCDGPELLTDRYRGAGVSHAVDRAIRMIRKYKPTASISYSITLAPPFHLDEVAAWAEERCSDEGSGGRTEALNVRVANLTGCEEIEAERLDLDSWRARYVEACAAGRREDVPLLIRRLIEEPIIKYFRLAGGPRDKWSPGGCCNPGVRRLFISADGKLYACERMGNRYPIGDVWSGIDEEAVTRMHEEFFAERTQLGCEPCWALRHCGGCWATGTPNCDATRMAVVQTLTTYVDLLETGGAGWLKSAFESTGGPPL